MAAKTSAAKKKAGSGGRSAKKTTSGVKQYIVPSRLAGQRLKRRLTRRMEAAVHRKRVAPGRIHIVDARLKK